MVTYCVISLLIVVHILDYLVFPPKDLNRWNFGYLVVGKHNGKLLDFMGKEPAPFNKWLCFNSVATRRGQVWRLVTGLTLHGGLFHLAANCAALWAMGPFLESRLGPWRYLLVLLASGVFVSVLSVIHYPDADFGVGASLAIYGALAVLAILLVRDPQLLQELSWPGKIYLLLYVLSNVVMPGSIYAHSFGFLAGAGLAFVVL